MTPAELAALPTWGEVETHYLRRVFEACEGNVLLATKVTGLSRATMFRKVAALGIVTSRRLTEEVRAEAQRQLDQAWEELRRR